jgi:hypothetical protein
MRPEPNRQGSRDLLFEGCGTMSSCSTQFSKTRRSLRTSSATGGITQDNSMPSTAEGPKHASTQVPAKHSARATPRPHSPEHRIVDPPSKKILQAIYSISNLALDSHVSGERANPPKESTYMIEVRTNNEEDLPQECHCLAHGIHEART